MLDRYADSDSAWGLGEVLALCLLNAACEGAELRDTIVYFEEEDSQTYNDGVIEIQSVGEIHRKGAARVITALMTEMGLYVQQGQGATIGACPDRRQRSHPQERLPIPFSINALAMSAISCAGRLSSHTP